MREVLVQVSNTKSVSEKNCLMTHKDFLTNKKHGKFGGIEKSISWRK